jgi:hypothetical protein
MKSILIIFSLFIFGISYAQGNSPACSGDYWNNCYGAYDYPSGNKYVGQWKDNKRNGQGTYTWSDGDKHVGGWKDDVMDGFGTVYKANGSIFQQGLWREGIFVRKQTLLEFNPPVVPKPPTPTNNAFGADWDLVRSGRDMDDYYDRGSINKSVSNGVTTITFNRLSQRETPKELGDKYYLSKTWSLVIRCQTNQYTDGYIKYYSKRWASGSMVGKYDAYDNWEVIPYGDVLDLKNKFCPSK